MNLTADETPTSLPNRRKDKRSQILEAGRKLVIEHGYPAVTMVQIAELADVSRATLYRYYSTKDQVYNDIAIEWGIAFVSSIRQSPPEHETVGERVVEVIRQAVVAAADNPKLMAAYIAILISEDELLLHDNRRLKGLMPGIIKIAIGQIHQPKYLELACSTLQHVLISNLILLNVGKTNSETVIGEMCPVAEQLLGDVWKKH